MRYINLHLHYLTLHYMTWFDGIVNNLLSCETLPRGNGWKLMTTGGAAKAQVLDP